MTEIQSDEAQETNGEDQEESRPQREWERLGMSQEDYYEAAEQSQDNRRKLSTAERKVQEARDLLKLLSDADANTTDDYDLSLRALYLLDRVKSALKSAAKKINKYDTEQRHRDVENWSKPRNLELGDDRSEEQKELVKRLDALPNDNAMEVISMYVSLGLSKRKGDEERRKEIFELLETQPVPWVSAYAHLADKGLVQATPKTDGAGATAE